ncbi:MAG: chemotaxis protein CheW [Coriobacteriia bacterium]|nr:chemotaxis protein CheW [Coriobacteriia bacterium]
MKNNVVTAESRQYVLFHLGTEEYGLPIERVQSIICYEQPTPVPHAPSGVEGVINLRGKVIPVIDLSMRLLGVPFTGASTSRIVVAEGDSGLVGLAVDSASEVVSISMSEIRPAPEAALSADTAEAFEGVANYGDRLIILLQADKVLPRQEFVASTVQEGEADV